MTAREMHYDYKQKLNRIDSQKYRGLKVPEIDWKLNEAQEVFVKIIAEPRVASELGFEVNQRTIDDVRTIVINQSNKDNECITTTLFEDDNKSYLIALPSNYWFYISSSIYLTKGACKTITTEVIPVQHDDESEVSPFNRSSFEWGVVNIRFISGGIRAFSDGSFSVDKMCMNYIKQPRKIWNAQDYIGGTYNDLGTGLALTGTQSCELPIGTHREIVDLAVLITAGDLSLPDFNFKRNKVQLTN